MAIHLKMLDFTCVVGMSIDFALSKNAHCPGICYLICSTRDENQRQVKAFHVYLNLMMSPEKKIIAQSKPFIDVYC